MSNKTETTHLEAVIDLTLEYLEDQDPASDEFARVVDQLAKLTALLPKKEPLLKPDQLIGLVGNLGGIIAILGYERAHVVTTKALGFVIKPRI